MDLFPSSLRLRNIFAQPQDISASTRQPIFDSSYTPDINNDSDTVLAQSGDPVSQKLLELYSQPSPSVDRYNQFLAEQPKKTDYEPSWKRRLGAALAGFGVGLSNPGLGFSVAHDITESPFDDALQDWTRQEAPLKAAASTEASNRTAHINMLKDYIQAQHQNTMDASLIGDRTDQARHRKATELQAQGTLLNTIADQQAREKIERDRLAETTKYHGTRTKQIDDAEKARQELDKQRIEIARQGMNNSTARTNAYTQNINSIKSYRDYLQTKYNNEKNTPTAQKTASELALYNVASRGGNLQKYSDYLEQDSHGKFVIHPPEKGMFTSDDAFNQALAHYKELTDEINSETNNIMSSTRNPPNTKSGTPKDVPPKMDNKKPKIITTQKLPGGI